MDGKFIKIFVESGFVAALLYFSNMAVMEGYYDYLGISDLITYQVDYYMMVRSVFVLILLVVVALFVSLFGDMAINKLSSCRNIKVLIVGILLVIVAICVFVKYISSEMDYEGLLPAMTAAIMIGIIEIRETEGEKQRDKNIAICIVGFFICAMTVGLYNTNYDMGKKRAASKSDYMMIYDSNKESESEEQYNPLVLVYQHEDKYIFSPLAEEGVIQRKYKAYSYEDLEEKEFIACEAKMAPPDEEK